MTDGFNGIAEIKRSMIEEGGYSESVADELLFSKNSILNPACRMSSLSSQPEKQPLE